MRILMKYGLVVSAVIAALGAGSAKAEVSLPAGFEATTVLDGIDAATALVITPNGRLFIAEQTGAVTVVRDGQKLPQPAIDLSERLDAWWERGLIGMALHPDFPQSPYVYLVYVAKEPYTHHVVSRFTVVGNRFDVSSEMILLEGDDQATLGGHVPAGHQGGPICFGQDGMLYVGLGEQTAGEPSQKLNTLQGKILRLAPDGRIPEDNPFYAEAEGKYRSIYATGIRNPFGLTVEPESGRLYETDVGGSAFEEVNEIMAGGNYGWPKVEGMASDEATAKSFINPLHAYPPAVGRSICGALFYPQSGNFPEEWKGKLFFVDWANHWMRAIDVNEPSRLLPFGEGFSAPVALAAAPNGDVYVLNRNTRWRDGKKFVEKSGSLVRVRYVGGSAIDEPQAPKMVEQLSRTGLFADVGQLQPAEGFHRFQLAAPMWRSGVVARRWIRLPSAASVVESPSEGPWVFPEGTEVIEHFDTLNGQRHETHVYQALDEGKYRVRAYRWDDGNREAHLVPFGELVPLKGVDGQMWFSPGPEASLDPELAILGFVPQFNGSQLQVGNQLLQWRDRGWLPEMPDEAIHRRWQALAALDDSKASREHRVRSYLEANCAHCHRPGGPSRGGFDARLHVEMSDAGLVNGPLLTGDLGIDGARLIVPGDPDRSMLLERLRRTDHHRMPPASLELAPSPVIPLMTQWIMTDLRSQEVPKVSVEVDSKDASAGNLPAFEVKTPGATYFLEKTGAGLSSLVDRDGNDWLGFHPEKGSGAGGEYRGFPNAVHQQAGNYFHARNAGTDPSSMKLEKQDADGVSVSAEGDNGKWACRYDFTAQACTFTMTKMPEGFRYWVLYEGTPGGTFDLDDWWMSSAGPEKHPMSENHEGDLPAPEWMAFGDPRLKRALVLWHHEDDTHPDRFYEMQGKMTVFGFGRKGIDKYLDSVPQSVSIALVESDEYEAIAAFVDQMMSKVGE